jgi:putative tryptophan/tyrosine transport system substrate-binding protein
VAVISRRTFLASGAAVLAAPLAAEAQQAGKVYRVGYLGNSSAYLEPDLVEALRQGLRNLSYVENQNIIIEYRWAEGKYDRFPSLVADLIQHQVDVIVTAGTPGTLAAKQATRTIPIVMAVSADAVGAGLVDSLARPGANVTGLTTMVQELEGKRVELLKNIVPRLSRIAVLKNPANPVMAIVFNEALTAARALHVTLEPVDIRAVDEFENTFATIAKARPGAILVLADRFLLAERKRIVMFAARQRLPAMYPYREFVTLGGLMSYSPNYAEAFRHAAVFVDKILKGAKPRDLPIEQPDTFQLVINLKTAKALGLTIPPSLLLRADQVIE